MIAMNLYNNAYLMPRIIHQMLSLLAILPHGTAFLSVYESNSGDSTGEPMQRALSITAWRSASTVRESCTVCMQSYSSMRAC